MNLAEKTQSDENDSKFGMHTYITTQSPCVQGLDTGFWQQFWIFHVTMATETLVETV